MCLDLEETKVFKENLCKHTQTRQTTHKKDQMKFQTHDATALRQC